MNNSVCKSLIEKMNTEKNVQTHHNRDVYRCEMILQKSLKLLLKGVFRINIQKEKKQYKSPMYR